MNFLNRAIKNVTRNKTKSILLIITFFLIGNLVIVGLGVSYAAENAKTLTRMKMKPVVSYEVDYTAYYQWVESLPSQEEMEEAYNNYPRVNLNTFIKLAEKDHVEAANAKCDYYVYPMNFNYIEVENPNPNDYPVVYKTEDYAADEAIVGDPLYMARSAIHLLGNLYPNMIEMVENTYELTKGSFYTQKDIDERNPVCLITEELAQLNNLSIGDTITIDFFGNDTYYKEILGEDFKSDMELKIIGIYQNHSEIDEQNSWMLSYPEYLPQNCVLLPSTVVTGYQSDMEKKVMEYYHEMWPEDEYYSNPDNYAEENFYSSFYLLLDDPLYVDEFKKECEPLLSEFTILNANDEVFNTFAKPLDTMSLFSGIIVWIVVINAIVIISLVTALTMKTREKEIGIYLAIGVEKIKVVGQMFVELAIVAIIGFSLAVISGSLSAKKIGQLVLDYQMSNTDTEQYYYYGDDYFTEISQESMLEEYEVRISPLLVGEIYALGLGVVFVSTLIPSIMIMRFNPKKILTDTY